ncbi:MAG: hypothetical protein B7Y02_05530 [Rhodobacterales bacterium 17-64-5]|nr:MAG: hypothetical protein B7Y02_05530 [Rhodobacterales bacterium 17-64-5]
MRGARPVRAALVGVMLGLAGPALGQAIESSPRPLPRPTVETPKATVAEDLGGGLIARSPRPLPRPGTAPLPLPKLDSTPDIAAPSALPADIIALSPRPLPRPKALAERVVALAAAAPALDISTDQGAEEVNLAAAPPLTAREKRRKKREEASMVGAVCGVPSIKGEVISPISSEVEGCGVEEAVMVTSVGGVRLSQPVTVDCSVVQSLDSWVKETAQPAFDGKLAEMQVAAHYSCRSRNNKKGAKISEHGKGRAIDISAFSLSDGQVLTVAGDYNKTLRKIYAAACGLFKTTLGPGSDGYHEEHFHFDTAVRNGGAYCR